MLLARSAARLRVAEYFDELVSQLDTRAEQLLVDPDNDDRSINAFRISIIDKIRDIEALNFRRIDDEPTDESPLLRPFCFVVFNKDFEFLTDLELVDGNFAYLVIPEACLTAENVVNYKNLLGFYNNYDGIDFSKLFKIKHQSEVSYILLKINNNVFLNTKSYILTKRDSELFMLDKFVIKDVLVESVDTHARFLFENMTTRVDFIYTNGFRRSDIAQTISLFNKNTNSQLSLKLLGHSFEPRPPQPSLIRLKTLCYEQCSVLVDQQFVNELAGFDFEELNIRYISKIEVNAFISLTATCHTLYLHSNKIEHVKSGHLNGLSNLHRLYLNECQLALVDPLTFSALNNLTFLNLYCNRIEKLTRGLFTGLASLEELNLKANRICEIEDDTFQPLTNLQFLDLESNRIERVSARTFAGLVRLKQLNLSSNRLSVLERGSFTHMSELEILKLNGNKLTETVDFENLKRLKSVCMDNNLILAAADLSVGIDRQQRTSGCVKKEIL